MKTTRSPRTAPKFSARARLIIAATTFALLVSVLGATAFMQDQKRPVVVENPTVMRADTTGLKSATGGDSGAKPEASASVGNAQESEQASASVGVDANQAPVNAGKTPSVPNVAGTCDTAGPIEVESSGGTAAGVPTPYATLALAFTAINGGTLHTGTITIDVCGNTTETGTAGLNQVAGVTSVAIAPAGGAARTISGAIAAGSPLINLNGADNVTINGLNTGGNSLTLSNTTIGTTAGSSTIRFIADASNNTVTNCSIQGSSSSTLATIAGTILFSTGTTTGNDNNIISNNDIGPAGANLPSKAIMASGTSSAIENDNAMITGNNIFDFFLPGSSLSGINILTGNEAWTISNNKFYQTATRTFTTTALRYAAITLNNTTGAFTVSGNIIGFGAANGTGTTTITGSSNEFRGIDIPNVNTTVATSVQGNVISGINQTSSRAVTANIGQGIFAGIQYGVNGASFTDGLVTVGNVTGNTIGSLDGSSTIVINATSVTASTIPVVAIMDVSFRASNISNNNIGAITIQSTGTTTGFRGIYINTGTALLATVNNNTIGGTNAAGAITDTQVGSYSMFGIQSAAPNLSATGNTIRNMSGASNGAALIVSAGILASGATGASTISQNTIHSLSNASGAAANSIYGMSLSLPATANVIERNLIHSFSLTSTVTGTQIWGINGGATGTATYKNNMIRLGLTAAGNSVTLPTSMIGIRDAAGSTNQFYHNSIYIGGTGVLATPTASNSYCFFSDVVTVTRAYQDNIFWNARSNAVAGGVAHLAIRVGGTAANPAGLTSNYNDLYFTGTDGATGVFNAVVVPTLAAWRTATGQDANSFAGDPQFIAPNGTAATVDLHIHPTNPTPIEAAGLAIPAVTDDYDGQARAGLTPTDIGADAGNFVALDISPPIISYTPFANTASTANRTLAVTISDATGVDSGANAPRIYFKKSTDAAYVSTQCAMTGGTAQNGTYNCTIDYSLVGGGSVIPGNIIQYFIVAQDTVGNLASNPGGATGANVNTVTFSGTPNSYTILASISGNKTVGAGGDYATLTAAVAALNGAEISAPVTLTLTDATYPSETFPITINANSGSSSTNTVTIKPTTGVSPTISGSSASCILNLNGADWMTLDGSNTVGGTSRDLTITNTNTGTSSAVVCMTSTGVGAGATNNTVKNNNLVGSTVTATAGTLFGVYSGGSTISITGAGADNDNNRIQNNNITKTSYGVYTGGASAANKNTGTVITQNVMNSASPTNITTGGILANFEDGIQITQNDISVLKHDGTTGTTGTAFGIALGLVPNNTVTTFTGSDVTNASVLRNKINGVTQLNTTGYSTFGIVVNSVTSGTTLVANNMISGVRSPSTASDFSAGIVAGGGTGSTTQIYFNSVSMTGARGAGATFPSYGLAINSGNPVVDVKNNIFYNTQTSGSTGKSYAIANASTPSFTNMTSNFNDLFVTGASGFVGQTGGLGTAGTDRLTLANWQTATLQDANSLSVDPLFVSPATDLHLQTGSPAINAGTTIATVTIDFDGQTRGAQPDIGADEVPQPGTLQFDSATYSAGEGDGTVTLNVTRTGGSDGAVSVQYATADGSATSGAGNDYTGQSGTLNWANGDTASKPITITLLEDATFEGSESFTVTLNTPTGGATLGTPSTATVTINDNDAAPTFSINDVTHMEGNSGTTAYVFTITKTGSTTQNATVSYETVDGSATSPSDFTAIPATPLVFMPADMSMQVTVFVNGDTDVEPDPETFTVHLSSPLNASITDADGTGTIENDDVANADPTISDIPNQTVSQDNSVTAPFTVGDAETPAASLTLTGTSSDQTLVPDANITFGGTGANRTVTVTPAPGQTGTATITVTVHDAANATASDSFLLTVNPVTCYAAPSDMVSWYTAEGNTNDIQGTNNGTLAGAYASGKVGQAFSLDGIDDKVTVPDSASLDMTSALTIDAWVYVAADADTSGQYGIVNKYKSIGGPNDGSRSYELFVDNKKLSFRSSNCDVLSTGELTFGQWNHVAATFANPGQCQLYINGQADNSQTATGSIQPNAEPLSIGAREGGDNFFFKGQIDEVELFSRALTATEIAGIYNASTAGKCHTSTLQFSAATYDVNENTAQATVTVTRTGAHDTVASVNYASADGSATGGASCGAGVDYETTSGTLNFAIGEVSKSFNVPVCDDLIFEGDETVNLSLDTPTGTGVTLGSPVAATLTIHDNEGTPSLSVNDVTFTGADSRVGAGFTVTLSHASNMTVTVHYATSDDTAVAGQDYTAANDTLTFAPGDTMKVIPITILADNVNEPSETFFIDLDTPTNATILDGHGVGTIPNDDQQPTISIDDVTFNGTDSRGVFGFTVSLSNPSSSTVTVHYATSDDTAVAGQDYTATSGTLTFDPGDTMRTVAVTILADNINEPTETFFVDLDTPTNATILDGHGVGTIPNDDAVPSMSINDVSVSEGDSEDLLTFTVTLSNPSSQAISAQFTATNGTATSPGDYLLPNGTVNFKPNQTSTTVTAQIVGDILDEANETFSVVLSSPSGASILDATGIGTIIDDDLNTGDFDGDGKNDLSVFRPNDDGAGHGRWYILGSSDGAVTQEYFGDSTDIIVSADYNGDGKKEIAIFRSATGDWYISHGSAQNFTQIHWGQNGDIPVPGDYDYDGKADLAVFRPGTTIWYILKSSDGQFIAQQWGLPTDRPVPSDYDADGKVDIAVFRPSDGYWYILLSSSNQLLAVQWGLGTDKLVPADYDLDGKTDVAVWRPSDGTWYILRSSNGQLLGVPWGTMGDIPVAGDYDGDGKADLTIWRPSTGDYHILESSGNGFVNSPNATSTGLHWGQSGDIPIASTYIPEQ
ncbi:MAG: Calx-beta domain-containing protein [Pyrinomonadaceae bacterium]